MTANAHTYEVTLVGVDRIGDRSCYHLALRPLLDASRYPLRELWVDQNDFQIIQLTYERPYDERHTKAIVHYRLAPVGNPATWAIVHIDAAATVHEFLSSSVERVSDDLSEISFPVSAPDWYFESPPTR